MKNIFFSLFIACTALSPLCAQETHVYPVVVLGGGVGALTSSLYLSRAGMPPFLIEGASRGGAIAQSPRVQNWPGELEISGLDLIDKLYYQVEFNGTQVLQEEVISVDFRQRPFTIVTRDLYEPQKTKKIVTNACIIALGSTPNLLGVPGEYPYWTKGVYNCAVCDGALYKNQKVAVVGGGDAAVLEAEHLANIAQTVYILVRKNHFRALEEKRLQELMARPNVVVLFNTTVQEIQGNGEKVTHLLIEQNRSKQSLEIDALFLAIGAKPNSQLFQGQLEMDSHGYILLKKDQETSVKGVFAVGDIVDPVYKQAIIAAGQGAIAACQVVQTTGKSLDTPLTLSAREDSFAPPVPAIAKAPVSLTPPDKVIEIVSLEHFKKELQKSSIPVCIDFYATWCGPCKTLSPMIDKWAKEHSGKVRFLKVNVNKVEEIAALYNIKAMPTLVILNKEGKEIAKKVGTQDITQYINKTDFSHIK